ncbi:MAG: cobaltochelatase subunit CobN, partial [Hyphomicrobiales bacterium]|nr:cobaltochelatase subunit CobN [Hyphomicrobiales bacterium]
MHLLAGETERIDDGAAAVDLEQTPGSIVVLSSADSDLSVLARAAEQPDCNAPSLRLANLMRLAHPMSVDLYVERTLGHAKLIVVRVLGGVGYWSYGLDRLRELARGGGPQLVAIPGDGRWDPELAAFTTIATEDARRLWRFLVGGGTDNAAAALRIMAGIVDETIVSDEPVAIANSGCYLPGEGQRTLEQALTGRDPATPIAPIVFYRSVLLAGSTAPIDALVAALADVGIAGFPIFVVSLKDRESIGFLERVFAEFDPAIVINTTSFAVSKTGSDNAGTVLDRPGRPVLQAILAGSSEAAWLESSRGLLPRDLTMNVVLPEIDGRLTTRAVSFKAETYHPLIDSQMTDYQPVADRIAFVAAQAAAWVRLATKPAIHRRVAIVLSNYPNRDGRLANGVGLDTPASATSLAAALSDAGYDLAGFPADGAALMTRLLAGQTNASKKPQRALSNILTLDAYHAHFAALPESNRDALTARWGGPENDPYFC